MSGDRAASGPAGEGSTKQATRASREAPTWRPFVTPERLGEVISTNSLLCARAAAGAPEGTVLFAERQVAGRGRLGRRWLDHPGGSILCSVLFRPSWPLERFHLASTTVALAAVEAVAGVCHVTCWCKWPNDLVSADGRKVAGILAETVPASSAVVVGVGVNCNWPEVFPERDDPDAAEVARRAVSIDRLSGGPVDREAVARAMLAGIARRWQQLGPGAALPDPEAERDLMAQYRRRCSTLGSLVDVGRTGEHVTGTALDVDDSGRLVVATPLGTRVFATGDVVHLRTAKSPGSRDAGSGATD
jgi:BirA family biotin operon repressor/biotin-[acetyl-CoA-carboxylase] ligase